MRSLKGLTVPPGTDWEELFTLYLSLDNHKVMPGREWYNGVNEKITAIGKEAFFDHVMGWLKERMYDSYREYRDRVEEYWNRHFGKTLGFYNVGERLENGLQKSAENPAWVENVLGVNYMYDPNENPLYTHTGYYFYYTLGGRLVRGLLHTATLFPDSELMVMVDAFAIHQHEECSDVLHIYKKLPNEQALARILRLQRTVKTKSVLKKIDAAIEELAKRMKTTSDQLKETVIPDFELDKEHRRVAQTGNYTVGIDLLQHKPTEIVWWQNGQEVAKVPASAKSEADVLIKNLKAEAKKLGEQVNIHRSRIEGFYRKIISWSFTAWQPHYIEHPLVGALGKRLIWQFTKGDQQRVAIWTVAGFRTVSGEILNWLDEQTTVELWHPVFADVAHVLQWRTYLTSQEIQQPFKQAFREVYLLTDAEKTTATYSNRFASHILAKDQCAALIKVKGWTVGDLAEKGPNIKLPAYDLQVAFATQDIFTGERSKMHGSAHITTGAVKFLRNKIAVPVEEVPAIIFSELMRDIDMFVGVTSMGNDPTWFDKEGEAGRLWRNHALGDLQGAAKVREDVLKTLIPRLEIADKCRFEGRFLIVTGTFRTYKIHMGSGNILMEPNDQYLCIVQAGAGLKNKLFLPFEGDTMLSIVISKALLLANDQKIKDETILRQINK
ncbi:DUF4132 domain-containing protein [Chitinophaga sp.]|uniref:DUF4132 domain-containing protein n=1 Tax=Chitinophaga sp. TaxID=1869181 RepID=UPI0031DD2FB3